MKDPANRPSDSLDPLRMQLLGARGEVTTGALIDRAQLSERQGRTQEARALYEQALSQLRGRDEAPIAASLLRWIALTYSTELNLDAAFDCLEAALAVAEAQADEVAIGHAVNVQASLFYKQGRLDDAERLYL